MLLPSLSVREVERKSQNSTGWVQRLGGSCQSVRTNLVTINIANSQRLREIFFKSTNSNGYWHEPLPLSGGTGPEILEGHGQVMPS